MLPETSNALPRPLLSLSRVSMSIRMSAAIFSSRDWLKSTFCIVPQRCFSCARARSVSPLVFASNHWSIFACEVIFWSTSRAS
jgi:hypothetical protein